jgi:hypothetical protein
MKQILAIFKKDAHHLWPEILASVAMVTALAVIYPVAWRSPAEFGAQSYGNFFAALARGGRSFLASSLIVLVPVTWWILIARLVHCERLVGNTQFWVTRPYEWPKFLAAKLLFLVAFLYIPFFLAQCALLAEAGFNPLLYLHGLIYNLVFATAILVLPLATLSSLTSGFGKLTLVLLGLVLYIAAVALLYSWLPFELTSSPSGPVENEASFLLCLCGCSAIVLAQYAVRRTRLAWLLLGVVCVLIALLALANPDRWFMDREYPAQSANAQPQLEFAYDRLAYEAVANEATEKGVLVISMPIKAQAIPDGIAVMPVVLKASIDSPGGAHWESAWQAAYSGYILAGNPDLTATFRIRRAAYDRFKSTPVTLRLTLAVDEARVFTTTQIPIQLHDFSVPNVGICAPQVGFLVDLAPDTIRGITCRSAMRQSKLTYVTARWSPENCSSVPADAGAALGNGWVGSLDPDSAEFGITSVWMNPLMLSNRLGDYYHRGETPRLRHLCPGSQMSFTSYERFGRAQVEMTIENFRLPAPQRFFVGIVQGEPTASPARR